MQNDSEYIKNKFIFIQAELDVQLNKMFLMNIPSAFSNLCHS